LVLKIINLDGEAARVYPAAFAYSAPDGLDEALELLRDLGEDGRVLAGGQSLIPMMKLRLAEPAHLVDINRLTDLAGIRQHDGYLAIGALARHADVAASPAVRAVGATVAEAARWVSDPLVRNRGTVCGSVAHCDPEGDWNSVMLAVGATVVARSADGGERLIPSREFVVDYFTNALRPGEMVTEVRVPTPSGPAGGTYLKLERKIGDYATVGVAVHLVLGDDGRIAGAGIALTAVSPRNYAVTEAEQLLAGAEPGPELFDEAAAIAARSCSPDSDVRGPADYKRAVVAAYTRRGLDAALAQARAA
jgi:carbon-monoxide dehydrogenase medium subunit